MTASCTGQLSQGVNIIEGNREKAIKVHSSRIH